MTIRINHKKITKSVERQRKAGIETDFVTQFIKVLIHESFHAYLKKSVDYETAREIKDSYKRRNERYPKEEEIAEWISGTGWQLYKELTEYESKQKAITGNWAIHKHQAGDLIE